METALAWPKSSKPARDPDPARVAAELVDETVNAIRNRGHTRSLAVRIAAAELGLGFRRVRSLLYGDPVVVPDEELARLRAAFLRDLDAEAAQLEARSIRAREQLARMLADGVDP
jgi:hypothetical protein